MHLIQTIGIHILDCFQLVVCWKVTLLTLERQLTVVTEEDEIGCWYMTITICIIHIHQEVNIAIVVKILINHLSYVTVCKQRFLRKLCSWCAYLQYEVVSVVADIVQLAVAVQVAGIARIVLCADKELVVGITVEHRGAVVHQVQNAIVVHINTSAITGLKWRWPRSLMLRCLHHHTLAKGGNSPPTTWALSYFCCILVHHGTLLHRFECTVGLLVKYRKLITWRKAGYQILTSVIVNVGK